MTVHVSAYEWGLWRFSCREARIARAALGRTATQADWWKVCPRPDWLVWNFCQLRSDFIRSMLPGLIDVVAEIVDEDLRAYQGIISWEREWVSEWLQGDLEPVDLRGTNVFWHLMRAAHDLVEAMESLVCGEDDSMAVFVWGALDRVLSARESGGNPDHDILDRVRAVLPAEWPAEEEIKI